MTDLTSFFFFKQKTAYEIPGSDWSSDVCSSDLKKQLVVKKSFKPFGEWAIKLTQDSKRATEKRDRKSVV